MLNPTIDCKLCEGTSLSAHRCSPRSQSSHGIREPTTAASIRVGFGVHAHLHYSCAAHLNYSCAGSRILTRIWKLFGWNWFWVTRFRVGVGVGAEDLRSSSPRAVLERFSYRALQCEQFDRGTSLVVSLECKSFLFYALNPGIVISWVVNTRPRCGLIHAS